MDTKKCGSSQGRAESKKLYQIWRVTHNVNKPVPKYCSYVKYENGNWAYPLIEVMSMMYYRWNREDFRSLNLAHLQETYQYLNEMRDDNEHYEIREVMYET